MNVNDLKFHLSEMMEALESSPSSFEEWDGFILILCNEDITGVNMSKEMLDYTDERKGEIILHLAVKLGFSDRITEELKALR